MAPLSRRSVRLGREARQVAWIVAALAGLQLLALLPTVLRG